MAVSKPEMTKKWHAISKYHRPGTKRSKTTKIAWHYTGIAGVPAINTWKYFNNHNVYASAHFIVGLEGEIIYAVPMDEIAYTTNAANSYSIGIECATLGSDDHYSDAEYKSMVKLGAWLAQYYGLDPRTDFIRHYDVTKKVCPRYFVNNSSKWNQFKLDCYNYLKGTLKDSGIRNCTNGGSSITTPTTSTVGVYKIVVDSLNVRKGPGTSYDIVTTVKKGEAYTITEVKNGWGKLKSGAGWINISTKYCQKIK